MRPQPLELVFVLLVLTNFHMTLVVGLSLKIALSAPEAIVRSGRFHNLRESVFVEQKL